MTGREQYVRDLHQLRMEIFQLGSRVGRMTATAVESVLSRDSALAKAVVDDECTSDAEVRAIEQHAELLIVLQAPVATDMRQIASALIVGQELERMADHALGIAVQGDALRQMEPVDLLTQPIASLGDRVTEMLRLALQAYLTTDAQLAGRVAGMDDFVDELYRQYYENLLMSMTSESTMVERGVLLMHIAYDLERIADRVTNICERAIFIATGEVPDTNVSRVG